MPKHNSKIKQKSPVEFYSVGFNGLSQRQISFQASDIKAAPNVTQRGLFSAVIFSPRGDRASRLATRLPVAKTLCYSCICTQPGGVIVFTC